MNKQRKIDYRFTIEIIAFVLLLYGISSFVYLNGDDFMYGAFAKTGIIRNVWSYYFSGNGRFWINVLDAALLWFDRFGFILVLPWIVLAFVVLLAKNVQRIMSGCPDTGKEKELIRVGMVLFCCLDILCLRETVFWITGMMNYLFPAVLFLWAYLMFQKSRAGELRGVSQVGYYLLCLLTASSVEQYALMFVGMLTLHYGFDLIKKRRISGCDWLAYALSILGLAALLFAPGNFVRVDVQGAILPTFIDNAWTLVFQDVVSPVALPYVVMLSLGVLLPKNKMSKASWTVCAAFLVGTVISPLVDKAIFDVVLLAVFCSLVAYQMYHNKISVAYPVVFMLFVGIGSQIMLLISAVWGYRCMLSLYLVYMLVIGCLLYHADTKQRLFVLASGILTSFHPLATLTYWGVAFLIRRKQMFAKKLTELLTYCGAAVALLILLFGYGKNAQTHKLNLQNTADFQNQTVIIQELPDDMYSWYFVPIGEFHEEYYRILHEIPETVDIVYQSTSDPSSIS